MTQTKHTPAPWKVVKSELGKPNYGHKINGANGDFICSFPVKGNAEAEAMMNANARLIASAPELLEALESLFNDYKSLVDSGDAGFWELEETETGKKALKAIAKAKG